MAGLSPLVKRVLTALLLMPLVVWGILALPTIYLAVLFGAVTLLGAWEWGALSGLATPLAKASYVVLVALLLVAVGQLGSHPHTLLALFGTAVAGWCLVSLLVWRFPRLPSWWASRWMASLAGIVVLVPAWLALVVLHDGQWAGAAEGSELVLFLMALVWAADSAAFFAGRRWGCTRLAPRVSPGKTWEGLWGAVAVTIALAIAGGWWLGLKAAALGGFLLLCLGTLLFSVLGDLLESAIKRTRGVKDSGGLLPGHGGVLDRIDSLTAAAPVFVFGLLLWGGLRG